MQWNINKNNTDAQKPPALILCERKNWTFFYLKHELNRLFICLYLTQHGRTFLRCLCSNMASSLSSIGSKNWRAVASNVPESTLLRSWGWRCEPVARAFQFTCSWCISLCLSQACSRDDSSVTCCLFTVVGSLPVDQVTDELVLLLELQYVLLLHLLDLSLQCLHFPLELPNLCVVGCGPLGIWCVEVPSQDRSLDLSLSWARSWNVRRGNRRLLWRCVWSKWLSLSRQ